MAVLANLCAKFADSRIWSSNMLSSLDNASRWTLGVLSSVVLVQPESTLSSVFGMPVDGDTQPFRPWGLCDAVFSLRLAITDSLRSFASSSSPLSRMDWRRPE